MPKRTCALAGAAAALAGAGVAAVSEIGPPAPGGAPLAPAAGGLPVGPATGAQAATSHSARDSPRMIRSSPTVRIMASDSLPDPGAPQPSAGERCSEQQA